MNTGEQARADALVDAETLRLAIPYPDPVDYAANGAVWAATHDEPRSPCSSTDAGLWAKVAAQLAFRAVPGLR